jgi:hypothetical protein
VPVFYIAAAITQQPRAIRLHDERHQFLILTDAEGSEVSKKYPDVVQAFIPPRPIPGDT